jgi:hypothetical protein
MFFTLAKLNRAIGEIGGRAKPSMAGVSRLSDEVLHVIHTGCQGLPTLVVTGGFGLHRMDEAAREVLAEADGRTAYAAGPQTGRLTFAGPPYA